MPSGDHLLTNDLEHGSGQQPTRVKERELGMHRTVAALLDYSEDPRHPIPMSLSRNTVGGTDPSKCEPA